MDSAMAATAKTPWEVAGYESREAWRKARAKNQIPANEEDPGLRLQRAALLREQANAEEEIAVKSALEAVGGNVRRAADILQVPHRTLDGWLRIGRLQHLRKLTARKPGRPAVPKASTKSA